MRYIRAIYKVLISFGGKLQRDAVAAFAAQAAFFMVISAFPLLMLLLSLVQFLPFLDVSFFYELTSVFPGNVSSFLNRVIGEVYNGGSVAIISVSAVALLWAASKGILAILRGMNFIYNAHERRNYFLLRGMAVVYTLLFLVTILFMLIIMVFGNSLLELIAQKLPSFYGTAVLLISFRTLGAFVILTLFFLLVYIVLPNRRGRFFTELPGAVLSALGWMGFSWLYAWYIDHIASNSYVYGSLSALVFIMLWLYFCMYIMFLGGELNSVIRTEEIRRLRLERRLERQRQKEKEKECESDV